jgi:response regulator of citrate/malate metabolism
MKKNSMIWLIDDDALVNKMNSITISKTIVDSEIQIFDRAQKALDVLSFSDIRPQLVFLDINMPEMTGFEFLEFITTQNYDLNVIMLSSSIDPDDRSKALEYKVVSDYIKKPLLKKKLLELFDQ